MRKSDQDPDPHRGKSRIRNRIRIENQRRSTTKALKSQKEDLSMDNGNI